MFFASTATPSGRKDSPVQTGKASGARIDQSGNNLNPQTPSTVNRPYKTRERLYYDTEYIKDSHTFSGNSTNSNSSFGASKAAGGAGSQGLDSGNRREEFNADELPPTASLHDFLAHGLSASSGLTTSTTTGPIENQIQNGILMSGNAALSSFANEAGRAANSLTRSVTVFGFPPNCRMDILTTFQGFGDVENYTLGEGNWLHITYASEWAAQKALTRNGTIFPIAGAMIGVVRMQDALEQVSMASMSFMSPVKRQNDDKSTNASASVSASVFLSRESGSENGNADLANLPSDSSIITRAVSYIFGS